jgi:predicted SAM-dependent methyltransferase
MRLFHAADRDESIMEEHMGDRDNRSGLDYLFSDDLAPLFWIPRRTAPSAWQGHVPFAHWLVHVARPGTFVELGTYSGVSYSAFCVAVEKSKTGTRCFAVDTWKGDKHSGFYDEELFTEFKVFHDQNFSSFSKIIRAEFDTAAGEFEDGKIDLIHFDGLHTYDAVRHDFETWLPKLSERAIALFHDTNERREDFGVWQFWSELRQRYPSFEFLHSHGLGVLCVGPNAPSKVLELCSLEAAGEIAAIRNRFETIGLQWSEIMEQNRKREIALRDALAAEHARMIAVREAKIVEQQEEITFLHDEIGRVRGDIEKIYGSRSWRITGPLRFLGTMGRRSMRPEFASDQRKKGSMDRTDILLSMFDSSGFGLEVGPSYNPLLPKSRFNVETIDHADAATLREKYSDNSSKIEEVDYISDGRSLLEIIGKPERYDFIFASHVIEHVTDIVRFIQDCETLLKPDGRLVLAVPDKRYCFDALRPISTVGQALQAYAERRVRHTPGVVFDQTAYVCGKAQNIVWIEPTIDGVALIHSTELAKQTFENALESNAYHDAHGWQFTPTSFRFLIKQLRHLGYIRSGELAFHKHGPLEPGMHEFYISLSKGAPTLPDADIDLLKQIESELHEIDPGSKVQNPRKDDPLTETAAARQQLDAANQKIRQLEAMNAALVKSTSWRVTAPLRYIRTLFL